MQVEISSEVNITLCIVQKQKNGGMVSAFYVIAMMHAYRYISNVIIMFLSRY